MSPIKPVNATALRIRRRVLLVISLAAVALCALAPQALGSFGAATDFFAGDPTSVAIGDLNGDSKRDLAAANPGHKNISVHLGNGAGSFGAPTNFAAGRAVSSIVISDLNRDSKPDLVASGVVLLGNGAGSFSAPKSYAAGSRVGDVNGDSKPDLVGPGMVLLGDGAGSFGAPKSFSTGATTVEIGDLNGDSKLDLATTNAINPGYDAGSVSVFLGKGAGSFDLATNFTQGIGFPAALAIGDLNRDAKPDLAVANAGLAVSVYLGNGAGSFGAPKSYVAGTTPVSVAIGDLNGDAKPDLAVGDSNGNDVSVLLGDGAGSFGAPAKYAAGAGYQSSVAVGDLNGDSKPDLAVAKQSAGTFSVLLNIGPPRIPTVSPAAGASGVARTAGIVAIFDRAMDKPSAEAAFSLRRTSDGGPVSGSFRWYGNALILVPDKPLANGTGYTATVAAGARDTHGDALAAPKTWQLTTATQPVISEVSPADNATEVLPNTMVASVFDAAMDKPSVEAAFSLRRTSDGAPISGFFAWYGNALIFKPEKDLAGGTQYTAAVSNGAKDLAGHPLPAARTWKFTTTNRPIVDSVTPANGAAGVSRGSVTVAVFNTTMDKPSAQAAFSLKRTSDGAAVAGSFAWYGNALIFKPAAPLPANTQYTAAVAGTAKDPAGRTLANPTTWHYTTGN